MAWLRLRSKIGILTGLLLSLSLSLGLSGCGKQATPPPSVSAAAPSVGKPLTEAECLDAAEKISSAINSGDVAALDRMIDWDAIYQRATDGIDAPAQFRKNFIKGLDSPRLAGNGISSRIIEVVKNGGSYKLLHSHTQEKRPWLLFRLLLPEAGVNYHDFLLARRPDGTVKAVDLHVYLSGEVISQTFRRPYLMAVAQNGGGVLTRLTGTDQKFLKYSKKIIEMNEASQKNKPETVLSLYKSLPAEFQMEKTVLISRIQAAQKLGNDAEYEAALEDYRKTYPNDPSTNIMSIDYYLLKKKYDECLECINRLDVAVLGDPYLQTLRASMHSEQNDLAAARADLKNAFEADPNLIEPYWALVAVSLKDKNFDETLKTLRIIRDKFHLEIGDLTAEGLYKEFVESPQYQEWLKAKPTAEPKNPADKPEP